MTHQEILALTEAHMLDPRPGDRFHEMYNYWVEVWDREGDWVVWWDTVDREVRIDTTAEFRGRFASKTNPGYWVLYRDAKGDTLSSDPAERAEWLEWLVARKLAAATGVSLTCSGL